MYFSVVSPGPPSREEFLYIFKAHLADTPDISCA